MQRPIPLRQIAASASVSVATVSMALRNSPRISASTREKVQRVARELGWRPNPLVSAWMAHRRGALRPAFHGETIAFLNCLPTEDLLAAGAWLSRFADGVHRRAAALGFASQVFWLGEPGMTPARMSRILRARGIRSVIVGSAPGSQVRLDFDWQHFAVAAQGFSIHEPNLPRAASSYVHTMRIALEALRHLGYQRIGLCLWPDVDERGLRIWSGTCLGEREGRPRSQRPSILSLGVSNAKLSAWLRSQKPDAVVAHDFRLLGQLRRVGVRVPEDVGFACLDLHPAHLDRHPELRGCAGVDTMVEFAGEAAVDLVASQLIANERGLQRKARIILTEGEWVPGDTVAALEGSAKRPGSPARLKPARER